MHAKPTLRPERAADAGVSRGVPLVAHVIYRLDVGGLENGLVNLINRIPAGRFRHAIVCLTEASEFRDRIARSDVPVFSLHKPQGNSPRTTFRLWRLLRQLAPDIIHTRNIAALEGMLPAALARVPVRIHGEHGRDAVDPDGDNARRQLIRRLYKPFVHHYVALSRDLGSYLEDRIGVPRERIARICNGVDAELFQPAGEHREPVPQAGFAEPGHFVMGTIGRMQDVKDQLTLARAFIHLMRTMPNASERLRLVMVGDGPLLEAARALLASAGVARYTWLPGRRNDVPRMMRALDLFVLPSLAEGISNTILEAMASGVPVVATAVGGNAELVEAGTTGTLVPPADPVGMAAAIRAYVESPELCRRHGEEGRRAVDRKFGMDAMVSAYMGLYDAMLSDRKGMSSLNWEAN